MTRVAPVSDAPGLQNKIRERAYQLLDDIRGSAVYGSGEMTLAGSMPHNGRT
jgi:hypothetical protein